MGEMLAKVSVLGTPGKDASSGHLNVTATSSCELDPILDKPGESMYPLQHGSKLCFNFIETLKLPRTVIIPPSSSSYI